jgi:hypothetical protein
LFIKDKLPMRILIIAALLFPMLLSGQVGRDGLRFVFYNVENLFDPFDDSLVADEEFLPGGIRGWTWNRFEEKLNQIHKVLVATGGWEPPEIIGLCEVENYFVLHRLVRETPLRKYEYRIIHRDSPDRRGIDVALLYRPDFFIPVRYHYYGVPVQDPHGDPTRDILYVRGIINGCDSLHLLINHWPSRWKGILESEAERLAAASILRHILDSLFLADNQSRILVAGDFNDEIANASLRDSLGVKHPGDQCQDDGLYLPCDNQMRGRSGSLKYHGRWYGFDLILVSGALLRDRGLRVNRDGFRIFSPGFLLEDDPQWLGSRPFRTYRGYSYHGGFSDHLPVYIDLIKVDKK